jgi:hypothetical protein
VKADWTPSGGSAVTLGDDSAARFIELGAIGGASQQQTEGLFRASHAKRFPRGNVAGECVFTVSQSHASRAAAMAFFKTEYARLNEQGSLVLTEGTSTITTANAVLNSVQLAGAIGLRWSIKYTFSTTTLT